MGAPGAEARDNWPGDRGRNRCLDAALNVGNATGFNVDSPVLGLSLQDVGSGVLAFPATALLLGLVTDRDEPASRVLGASAMVGVVTIVVDLFG
jgi:hypothetical protein